MMYTFESNTFAGQLDELLALRDTLAARQIDASACQTRSDWGRAHRAEERYEHGRAAFLERWQPAAERDY